MLIYHTRHVLEKAIQKKNKAQGQDDDEDDEDDVGVDVDVCERDVD